ncbi:FAS1-like dehydratase domain-containing protein [Arcicella lustrica]|uniref:MaoC family dehydratase N-terminal domain-containing protein n=1 Tax=Arcicella lustrica TaxID=2984196 RepID=A0ABU5SQH7_9BACT|nr:MaoC family dehydratase N-terminal domain-containing protein [Arcicella sp. DC25W]MEA5429422.1 MaoC family dehydratase N-terminal domain-containing protein [Arcicella sp. DC25W]
MQDYLSVSPIKSKELCSSTMVRRVAAMLDLETQSFAEGDILPKGWHFFMLAGETRKSELRKDGFPGLGVPIPDLGLPRLLLGGRTVAYHGKIVIGSVIEKSSFIKNITEKTTKNGQMAIVTLQHELCSIDADTPAIVETQTYILLEEQKIKNQPVLMNENGEFTIEGNANQIIPDETLLFQYSALGFNSHKIHLDRNYTQQVERLPDLVVNGGLATLLMTEFLRKEKGVDLKAIKVKHIAPLYCNRPLRLEYKNGEGKIYDDIDSIAVEMEIEEFAIDSI